MGGTMDLEELRKAYRQYAPSTTTQPMFPAQPIYPAQPNVCPGCGRCRDCGRQAVPAQPFTPWPSYPNPWRITYGNITTSDTNTQVWSSGNAAN